MDDIRIPRVVLAVSIKVIREALRQDDMETVREALESLHQYVMAQPTLQNSEGNATTQTC